MADPEERPPFEILEHTADIGLLARGKTLEELFENAAAGLLAILGVTAHDGSNHADLMVEADDRAALLVRFLDELIYLVDTRGARISDITVSIESPIRVRAGVSWTPSEQPVEGTELKATTFHQLSLEEHGDGYEATVYFDV